MLSGTDPIPFVRTARPIRSPWLAAVVGACVAARCVPAHADEAAPAAGDRGDEREVPDAGAEAEEIDASESWREPSYLVPAVEIAVMLTFGGIEYWVRSHSPRVAPSTWVDRLSTNWFVLDPGPFRFNYAFHAFAGSGYHLAARTNDLGLVESTLYSLAASLVWEYLVEYREKVDVNDLIVTAPAGIALGEFGHALGRLLRKQPSGLGWGVARWTLGLPQSFNDTLRGVDSRRGPGVAHRFRVSAGASRASGNTRRGGITDRENRTLLQLRLGGRLARLDGLYAPGWRGFADGNFTSLDVVLTAGAGAYHGASFLSDTFLAGWRYSDVDGDGGRAINLGSAISARYRREQFGSWSDRLGVAHLPGLATDAALWGPAWRLEGVARLHPDYGGVGALSHRRWADANPGEVGWSAIEDNGFYHALGVSGRLRAKLTVPYVTAGAALFAGRYWNHDWRDLRESEITVKQQISTRVADYDLWLRGALTGPFFVEARLEGRHRWEDFEDLDATARLFRAGLQLGASF